MDDTRNADDLAAQRPVKAMATPAKPAKRLPVGLEEDEDDGTLLALGAALVMTWEDVPQDLQRVLFERAADVMRSDQSMKLREQLARFLHDNKDDAI